MGLIALIVLGAIVGFIIHLFSPTTIGGGVFAHIVVGVLGSLVGGFLSTLLGLPGLTGINIYSILIGIVGAVVFAYILNLVQKA